MSILDDQNLVMAASETEIIQHLHPMHLGKFDAEYENVRAVYYPIKNLYQSFFFTFCRDADIEMVNKKTIEELIAKKAYSTTPPISIFQSIEELQTIYDSIKNLQYPASYEDMLAFLKRVLMGDLEFMCRYPDADGVTPMGRIKAIELS